MKLKSLLSIVALSMAAFVQAQIGPGLFAGGSIGINRGTSETVFGSTTTEGPTVTMFTFQPSVGYFFTENVAAGVRFLYSNSTSTQDVGNTERKISETGVGAEFFARYAALIGGSDSFGYYAELNGGFASFTGEEKFGSVTTEDDPQTRISVGIQPGLIYFPSPRYGFEASLGNIIGFTSWTSTDANDDDNTFSITNLQFLDLSTMGLELGFHYYFNR